ETEVEVTVRGGVLYPIDAHLHPGDFMQSLHAYLEKEGVEFILETEVTGFEKSKGKITKVITNKESLDVDELILATGSWLPVVSESLGINILLQAGKGYSMTFENRQGRNLQYPAILVDHRVAMTPMGSALRMGGTMEISGLQSPKLIKRARAIYEASSVYYPNLSVEFPEEHKIWSGLRPLSPDGLPYIGRHSKYANLIIAGGHAMLGISLSAGTGKLVQEIVDKSSTSIEIAAFDVERY
ncbi:MAG: NAD(P)/FAD-dependent oxidoreductase, partial [Bacteroidota bacterium]